MKNHFSSNIVLAMLFACFVLQGCGVKGDLELPSQQNEQQSTPTKPETSVSTEQ